MPKQSRQRLAVYVSVRCQVTAGSNFDRKLHLAATYSGEQLRMKGGKSQGAERISTAFSAIKKLGNHLDDMNRNHDKPMS